MQYPHRGSHPYPTAVGPPKTDQNSELIRGCIPCLIITEPGQDDDADRSRYFTPRPLLLVAGSGHSSNLEALHHNMFPQGRLCTSRAVDTTLSGSYIHQSAHGRCLHCCMCKPRPNCTRKASSQWHHYEQKHRGNVPNAVSATAAGTKALSMFSRIAFVSTT